MKKKERGIIIEHQSLTADIRRLCVKTTLAKDARPGQFAGLFAPDRSMLLPRPISVADAGADTLTFVYRVAGAGTGAIAALSQGDGITLSGMLGNGFPLGEAERKEAVLIGGGVGIPPLLFAARHLLEEGKAARVLAVLGYRDSGTFLKEEFEALKGLSLHVTSDDGSVGYHGNSVDGCRALCKDEGDTEKVIFACGPKPMLRGVQELAADTGARAYLSLEERMACGVGVCLACVCETRKTDAHSNVNNARVCTEGPVFFAEDVVL